MTILESDVRFRASQRMTDFTDGGGLMSTTVMVDGVDNNLFDDITDLQRLFGHLSLRKVYGAVLSNNADTYISAHALVDVPPGDDETACFLFATGGLTTERAAAVAALEASASPAPYPFVHFGSSAPSSEFPVEWGKATVAQNGVPISVADNLRAVVPGTGQETGQWLAIPSGATVSVLEAATGITRFLTVGALAAASFVVPGTVGAGSSISRALPVAFPSSGTGLTVGAATTFYGTAKVLSSSPSLRCFSCTVVPAGAASGATTVEVASTQVRVVPIPLAATAMPANNSAWGISGTPFTATLGRAPAIAANDAVLIHSTIANAPAAQANGSTATAGRTNASRLRVIGNNGVVHASFVLNQPAPSGVGCTANLAAGTVTFTDVSGMSQPLTLEHRIEEMSVVSSISGNTLTLNRALSRAYPAGTRVSSLLMLGDLKARVGVSFAQNAWTGVFSDTVLGGSPAADYDIAGNPITVTNQGAVNERWYALFTNTTTFRLVGEQLGEIGTFSTGSVCAPNNPATGVPYLSIAPAGWGGGWAAGNVLRVNTAGANAPIWVGRSVAPSTPSGDDSVTLQLRGYVNT